MPNDQITSRSGSAPVKSELETFLEEVKQLVSTGPGTRGRLIFALDASASRQPDVGYRLHAAGRYVS
jgi:hypothetical protein